MGQPVGGGQPRRWLKKSVRSAAHSSPRTPVVTWNSWFNLGSEPRWYSDPSEPASGFGAPQTTLLIRDAHAAPAQRGHGSRVTTRVASSRCHDPNSAAASRRASTSACAVGSPVASLSLCRLATIRPPATTTAPTGTSPCSPARWASASANAIRSSSESEAGSSGCGFMAPTIGPPERDTRPREWRPGGLRHPGVSAEGCCLPALTRFTGPGRTGPDRHTPERVRSNDTLVARNPPRGGAREGCESGRFGTLGKRVWLHSHRGFESHSLRRSPTDRVAARL